MLLWDEYKDSGTICGGVVLPTTDLEQSHDYQVTTMLVRWLVRSVKGVQILRTLHDLLFRQLLLKVKDHQIT